jgi:hypothetical protein
MKNKKGFASDLQVIKNSVALPSKSTFQPDPYYEVR